ncbi:histidine kinase [Paenibacillus sp. GD4]|uniref:sensor histidine kinase n=1 Tax=Paenibacillus sp. GD4 TaxID=3068890 RepID=UPI002796BBE1|nr:histidine kinase [Paenibacillus sp. GD4]MDQ1914130.1 histidine kinase [Paenibacillus sp. GD4]
MAQSNLGAKQLHSDQAGVKGLLFYYNYYAVHVVHTQVASSNKSIMSLYMKQIDAGLNGVDQYLLNLTSSEYDIHVLNQARSEEEFVLAKMRIINKLDNDALMYSTAVNSIFVYSQEWETIAATLIGVGSREYTLLNNYIQTKLFASFEKGSVPIQWFVRNIGNDYYLFRLQPAGRLWLGAWVNLNSLQKPLSLIDFGDNGSSLFIAEDGTPLTNRGYVASHQLQLHQLQEPAYTTGPEDEYYAIAETSTKGEFGLAAVVAKEAVLQKLPYLNRIVIGIALIGILLIPLYFLYLRRLVLVPLNRIVYAMNRIGVGSLETRIEPFKTSDEFATVNHSFNNMIEQIRDLKISVYEEQLSKQKAELQHLQLQINPHFFMNTLNLIYSLALDKDYELIKDMTLRLVKHFRYMFGSNLTFVPLKEELEHVRNYLAIHELRFQQQFVCRIQASESLYQAMVPPLIIQTFVENSLKYASSVDHPLALDVTVHLDNADDDPAMVITIEDEGDGFEERLLPLLNAGERIVDEQGEHIGAWNAWHRLRLLYGERSRIQYSNRSPHGAKVVIRLPFYVSSLT